MVIFNYFQQSEFDTLQSDYMTDIIIMYLNEYLKNMLV